VSKKKQKRSYQAWKKPDPTEKKPDIKIIPSSPNAKVSRIIDRDQQEFAARPGMDWFIRPCVPGEFAEIAATGEMDLSAITHTLVKRMGPGSEQMRMPMTDAMAQSWIEFATKDGGSIERREWTKEGGSIERRGWTKGMRHEASDTSSSPEGIT
jgi:hypothetical protein